MADDVTLPGTGAVVAADEVGGKKFQRMKVAHGPDGVAVDTTPETPFPVELGAADAGVAAIVDAIGSIAAGGDASAEKQDETKVLIGAVIETAPATDTASSGLNGRLQRIAQRLTSLIGLFPASLGQKAKSAALAVTLASDEDLLGRIGEVQASPTSNTVLDRLKALLTGIVLAAGANIIGKVGIDQTTPGTTNGVVMKNSGGAEINFADPTAGALSQVASSATAVTVLAANTSRKGATIFNDSTQVLYLGLSNTTPTSSAYTVKMAAASYFEVPAGYNGIIKGIWASANGNAVVTELT